MKKAKFWVDIALEAGDVDVCHIYSFEIEMPDEEYEELYQVWFSNNSDLNSWRSNWDGHYELFDKLNVTAYHALNDLLKKHDPKFVDPVEVFWSLSKETTDEF